MSEEILKPSDDISVHKILQQIKDGLLDPATLSKENRQLCVEALIFEGYQVSVIAHLLKKSDRTIRRDVQEIWQKNSLTPSLELAKQFIGEMVLKGKIHHSYLMRIARLKEASTSEKAQAEFFAWRIQKEVIEKLQTLGFLPSRPTEIIGNFFHRVEDDEKSIEEMKKMLSEVEEVSKENGELDEDAKREIEDLRVRIEQTEIVQKISKLKKDTLKEEKDE